ncbi:MAG TPA: cupredoxin family copper-binding protein [Candidatus Babeliales bacterium]|nr:cupredoxin family copper-binding protein [Candidatus Babeliales bacterium]
MRRVTIIIVAVTVLALLGWIVFGRNSDNTTTNSTTNHSNTSNQPVQNNSNTANQATSTNEVEIEDMAFKPDNITVKKGAAVTWTNKDSTAHTVTENDGKNGPSSQLLNQGQSYTFTFSETGSFQYRCTIHPNMSGTVIVTD